MYYFRQASSLNFSAVIQLLLCKVKQTYSYCSAMLIRDDIYLTKNTVHYNICTKEACKPAFHIPKSTMHVPAEIIR